MVVTKSSAPPITLIPKPRTAADNVADVLRENIVKGTLHGGEALRQDELAEQFGVSRMPVRDALRQLDAEGLVTVHPTRGCFVALLDPNEIREIYSLRELVESEALQLAFPTYSSAVLDNANTILAKIDNNVDVGNLNSLNSDFHMMFYRGCNNSRLISLIESLHRASDRYVRMFMSDDEYGNVSQNEHRDILSACQKNDVRLAVNALKHHLNRGASKLVTLFSR